MVDPSNGFGVAGRWRLACNVLTAVGEIDAAKPNRLVVGGPHAYSRNPMYVAWDAMYVGIALIANALWPLLLFPAALLWNHVQVLHEERNLVREFGAAYRDYRSRTRRYL